MGMSGRTKGRGEESRVHEVHPHLGGHCKGLGISSQKGHVGPAWNMSDPLGLLPECQLLCETHGGSREGLGRTSAVSWMLWSEPGSAGNGEAVDPPLSRMQAS